MATLTSVEQAFQHPAVGERAPSFSLPSVCGPMVDLASYRERRNVIVWFSRGFTCPFCRIYTDGIRSNYAELQTAETEVIQVAPNLLESARRYFGSSPLPFPFVCDPDKRLFAVYGLGDRGVLEFLIDKQGVIRNVTVVGPIDPVPSGAELAQLARSRCGATPGRV